MSRFWGQAEYIRNMFRELMKVPLPEAMSMRQVFYTKLPEIERFVPERIKAKYPNWAKTFYEKMCEYASDMFLDGEVSYRKMNLYDDSGASQYIYQYTEFIPEDVKKFKYDPEMAVEVWVENNATFNSIRPLVAFSNRSQEDFFRVNLVSGRGFIKSQQIEALKLDRRETETILYMTDFDPSGIEMRRRDLQCRLNRIGLQMAVSDVGIYPEQIPEERRGASIARFKRSDPNAKKFIVEFGDDYPLVKQGFGYELQALNPTELRQLVIERLSVFRS